VIRRVDAADRVKYLRHIQNAEARVLRSRPGWTKERVLKGGHGCMDCPRESGSNNEDLAVAVAAPYLARSSGPL
jgi:hypothetical protein